MAPAFKVGFSDGREFTAGGQTDDEARANAYDQAERALGLRPRGVVT